MRVGFNVLPLRTGHRTRGVGSYARLLLENLKKKNIEIIEFEDLSSVTDVEVIHYPWFDFFYRTLPIKKTFPTVVTIHDVTPLLFPKEYPKGVKGKINLEVQKISLKSCQQIITVSLCSKKDISRQLRIREDKINVVYSAAEARFRIIPSSEALRVKRKYNLPDRFLLYVGDANFNKNLPFLIDGFKKIREDSLFNNLKLVLLGGVFLKRFDNIDHPELKNLKLTHKKITEYNLENEVFKPGQVEFEDLVAFYNLATIYIQPSLYEGFGLPLLEAFSCGTPVVSSNTPALKEIGGSAAVYFNPENLNSFVELVIEVLQSRHLQDKLSKLGLNRAGEFSWEKTADETIEVYKKAIFG